MAKKQSEPQIVSASRRTDIPAFYTPWFINRIHAGYCTYPNPLYRNTMYRVDLRPEVVAGIVFWTRSARPLIPHLNAISSYPYYFQYTLIGYPKDIDPYSPGVDSAVGVIQELSQRIGKKRVVWRYDPLVLSPRATASWHRENFMRIAERLAGHVERVVLSVVDPYRKTQRRLSPGPADDVVYEAAGYRELLEWLVLKANDLGLRPQSCAEPALEIPGLVKGACIDADLLAEIAGRSVPKRRHNQRPGCLCHRSVDIGVNDTCGFGCRYCYATSSHKQARAALKRHNPNWPCLVGDLDMESPVSAIRADSPLLSRGGLFE